MTPKIRIGDWRFLCVGCGTKIMTGYGFGHSFDRYCGTCASEKEKLTGQKSHYLGKKIEARP